MTSNVEECCLKLKIQCFCISNISTPRRLFCNKHENKYHISIPPLQKRKRRTNRLHKEERKGRFVMSFFKNALCRDNGSVSHHCEFQNAFRFKKKERKEICFVSLIYDAMVLLNINYFCFI